MFYFLKPEKLYQARDLETFFITFDEPLKDQAWEAISQKLPHVQRIDSVKGFDKAHKACADKVTGQRFLSIDGDNELLPAFYNFKINKKLMNSPYILSWASVNSINGLRYGNGGVKCWPTQKVHEMNCHENSKDEKSAIDFCYQLQYFLMKETLTVSNIHHTPYQAFRSGFREGIKMSLIEGEKLKVSKEKLSQGLLTESIAKSNLERLRIWCTIGQDIKNGIWAIYGARMGLAQLYIENMPLENIRDYDWFDNYWQKEILSLFGESGEKCELSQVTWNQDQLIKITTDLKAKLNNQLNLAITDYNKEQSQFFKSTYKNRERKGLLM